MTDEINQIKLAVGGDDEAYGRLIEAYQKGLVRYCFTILKDWDSAEDVAQEAFIKAYEKLGRYNPQYKFSTWLYRIAHNLAINSLRRSATLPFDEEHEIAHVDQTPAVAEREEREALVRKAVEGLPVNYQTVIHLHYWEGRPYEEIGQIMNVPATTIKTWLYRARQELKEQCNGII